MTLTCDVCGTVQDITAYDSVNVTLNPELKQKLLDGELSKFVCRTCNWSTGIVYPVLYHDMKQKFMIWLRPGTAQPETTSLPLGPLIAEYTLRLVESRNDLVEKVLLFDEGLDDRAFEFLKLSLRVGAEERTLGTLLFSGRTRSPEGEDGLNLVQLDGREGLPLYLPMKTYDEVVSALEKTLPPALAERGRWLRVNPDYAAALAAEA